MNKIHAKWQTGDVKQTFFFEIKSLKTNNNNSVCENMDWQKGKMQKGICVSMKNASLSRLHVIQF